MADLQATIEELWERREELSPNDVGALKTVSEAIDLLDTGEARIAEVSGDDVIVHEWLKRAVLLIFRLRGMETIEVGPFEYADKLPLKTNYEAQGVRVVPGGSARWGSYLGRGVILMPSYVNIGARVESGSMVDTWATVGSCAQIGRDTHLAGGVGIGGVLEPANAAPVMIGNECMIGSRSMITQGARVGDGAILGEAVLLNPTIPVYDASSGEEISRGVIPPWSVAKQSWRMKEFPGGTFGAPCVLIVQRLTEGERHDKSKLNDILRDHGVNV